MSEKKINLNFKVTPEIKGLIDRLVVLKTVKEMKKSSQHAVLEEALVELMKKYSADYENQGENE